MRLASSSESIQGSLEEQNAADIDRRQKPFFRTTTGLIPSSVWFSHFGTDRSQLIGHKLNPVKLEAKIPQNLANLDLHLCMLEPTFRSGTWAFPTATPSLADISLYYQLRWGIDIAAGKGINNLTGGETEDTNINVTEAVFNEKRYPGLWRWFHAFEGYLQSLPRSETVVAVEDMRWKEALSQTSLRSDSTLLVPAAAEQHPSLDAIRGLVPGVTVSVAPDDTGRDNPTVGTLVKIGVEELVIVPNEKGEMNVQIHFPRLGFIVKTVDGSKL